MAEKVTTMVLKVDLQCPSCYKKIKRLLCKFPQIRDQVYNEKQNTVTITVVCCSPEKIRDKLCCKGGKTIKSIEIIVPKPPPVKPKEPEKPKPPPEKPPEKPKEPEKPKPPPEKPKEPEKPKPPPEKPKEPEKPKPPPEKPKEPAPAPITAFPCYVPCYMGHPQGPSYYGSGTPAPPPPCYDFYGRKSCDDYGKPCHCHANRCDLYFCEENPSGCTIM